MTTMRHLKGQNLSSGLRGLLVLFTLASLALTACSSSSNNYQRDSEGNIMPSPRQLDPASTLYSDTLDAANAGNCSQETISVLTCYAYRGHGYEGAQTALGQCLIKTKSTDDGITWLTRAADAGWPDAQKSLAQHYLNGDKTAVDLPESGKWSLLYRKNPSLLSLGVSPEKKLIENVNSRLSADEKTEAIRRANGWNAKFWTPDKTLDNRANAYCYAGPARRVINKKEVLEGIGMPLP